MRLLWIHQNFVGRDQPGNTRAAGILDALERRGHEIDLLATSRSYMGTIEGGSDDGVTCRGSVRIHRLAAAKARSRGGEYLAFLRMATPYALRLGRPDALISSTPSLPQVAPALLLAAAWRVPVLLEIRDLWPAFLEEGGLLPRGPIRYAMRALEGAAMRQARQLVVVGPAYQPYLIARGISPDRITIAPTGGRREMPEPSAGHAWRCAHGLENKVVFLYAGSFNEAYDISTVVEAARILAPQAPEAMWVFVGGGRGAHFLEEASSRYAFVRCFPAVKHDDMGAILAGSDVVVNPHSDWPLLGITFSGKVFEAMSAGLPVLSLRRGAMGTMLEVSAGGLVASAPCPESFAAAALALIRKGPAARSAMGAAGRDWILREMPSEKMANLVCDAVERLRQGPQRRHALTAWLGGVNDALLARSPRTIASVYGNRVDAVASDSLLTWLQAGSMARNSG